MSLQVTGMTVSVDFGDTEYGKGTKSYMSLSARCPEGEQIPIESTDAIINAGLDMYLTAFETMMAARCAAGTIKGDELKTFIPKMKERVKRLKALLPTL